MVFCISLDKKKCRKPFLYFDVFVIYILLIIGMKKGNLENLEAAPKKIKPEKSIL